MATQLVTLKVARRSATNRYKVPQRQWRKWDENERCRFNEVYSTMVVEPADVFASGDAAGKAGGMEDGCVERGVDGGERLARRIANEKLIYGKYKDKEARRVYQRDLMRRRRAEGRA